MKIQKIVILGMIFFVTSQVSWSAQDKVVGPEGAKLYREASTDSEVLDEFNPGETVRVGNQPNKGYFRARGKSGLIGFLPETVFQDGNQVSDSTGKNVTSQKRSSESDRFLIFAGKHSLSLADSKNRYGFESKELNGGLSYAVEYQMETSKNSSLYYAFRVEYFSGSFEGLSVNTSTTQAASFKIIPILAGVHWDVHKTDFFRFGVGPYLGFAPVSQFSISRTTGALTESVDYRSYDFLGMLNIQAMIRLFEGFRLGLETGYRYQSTGQFERTSKFGGISGFKNSYSGIFYRVGLEIAL